MAAWQKVDSVNKIQLTIFTGREKPARPGSRDRRRNPEKATGVSTRGHGKTGDPYDNETDNYSQTHYQLFYTRTINTNWKTRMQHCFLPKGKDTTNNIRRVNRWKITGFLIM